MTLGYWDIRGVREQSVLERGRRRVDGEMLHSLGAGSTKTVLREGRSPARFGGLVNGSVCVCACERARGGRVRGSPAAESHSRSQDPPYLTTVVALSPSWLTPSDCSWNTQTPTMRRRSTRWGTVMASSFCSDFSQAPADLVPGTCALATCCSPLLPLSKPL